MVRRQRTALVPMHDRAAEFGWLARMLQASDSAFPTGAYAHSFGLEGLVQAGVVRDRAGLALFLHGQVLPQLARSDLPVAARAWEACGAAEGGGPDWERLRRLCELGVSLRGTRETRAASVAVGRQRIEMAALLHGGLAGDFAGRAAAGGWAVPSCVAAGVEGRLIGSPLRGMLTGVVYAAVSGLVAAAVKLLRLGQNAVQTLIAETMAKCSEILDTALAVAEADIGFSNPWWDIASSRHETADFRLFIS